MKIICTLYNYFRKESARVIYLNGSYRFMVGNFISMGYETEKEVIRELVKREFYLN